MENKANTLSSLYNKGLEIHGQLENSSQSSNSKQFQDDVSKAVLSLEQATHMASELSLFSTNEMFEEISTPDLKYLLLPALLGSLTLKITNRDRLQVLETAEIYFVDFLKRLKSYGIINLQIPQIEEEVCKEKPQQQTMNSLQSLEKAGSDRKAKIERYLKHKELKQKQLELQKRIDNEELDDEKVREFYEVTLNSWSYTALEELENIQKEKPLVRLMMEMKASGKVLEEKPKDLKPLKPIILARNDMQKKVLGIGYPSRPILTVDEFYAQRYGHEHAEDASVGMSMQKWAEDPEKDKEELEKEAQEKEEREEKEDQDALMKARNWDDWKDDHRRGWGNRHNMG